MAKVWVAAKGEDVVCVSHSLKACIDKAESEFDDIHCTDNFVITLVMPMVGSSWGCLKADPKPTAPPFLKQEAITFTEVNLI